MSEPEFTPGPILQGDAEPSVSLAYPLFVIKGTYTDPRDHAEKPLPPHLWLLATGDDPFADIDNLVVGMFSDKTGISVVPRKVPVSGGTQKDISTDTAERRLILQPLPKIPADVPVTTETFIKAYSESGLNRYSTDKEVWLDLDKQEWVATSKVKEPEKRKLLCFPYWNSTRKATDADGGGFGHPGPTPDWEPKGTFKISELTKPFFGTRDDPWTVHLDHEWFHTFLQFRFYDWTAKAVKVVPPGLIVKARGASSPSPELVGGGTAVFPDGTVCVLHHRTKSRSGNVTFSIDPHKKVDVDDYLDPTPRPYVDLEESSDAERVKFAADTFKDDARSRAKRYFLPIYFVSRGWEARLGPSGSRDLFENLRQKDTSHASPLIFLLDDAVIVNDKFERLKGPELSTDRITLFDRLMRLRDPDGGKSPQSKVKFKKNYLRGEDAVFQAGEPFEATTFVAYYDGLFYDLVDLWRYGGDVADSALQGLRRFKVSHPFDNRRKTNGPLNTPSNYDLHFFANGAYGNYHDPKGGPAVELHHLVAYVAIYFAKAGDVLPNKTVATAAHIDAGKIDDVRANLLDSERRWEQFFPVKPDLAEGKDYVIVPEAGAVAADSNVVRMRFLFREVTSAAKASLTILVAKPVTGKSNRSSMDTVNALMVMFSHDIDPGGDTVKDSDGVDLGAFTLAHELGHAMGLPDEYVEATHKDATEQGAAPHMLRFNQVNQNTNEIRPFTTDRRAMLVSNRLPRLRHYWHHAEYLNNDNSIQVDLKKVMYGPSHRTLKGGTKYIVPKKRSQSPWKAAFTKALASRRADIHLFYVGRDEGSTEAMFKSYSPGLLVVRCKLFFRFSVAIDTDDAFEMMRSLNERFFDNKYQPSIKLGFSTVDTEISNVQILFLPQFEFDRFTTYEDGTVAKPADAHVVIDVYRKKDPLPGVSFNLLNFPAPGKPPVGVNSIEAHPADLNLAVIRYALGLSTCHDNAKGNRVLTDNLTIGDIAEMAILVQNHLAGK